jgi:hypothetical protein
MTPEDNLLVIACDISDQMPRQAKELGRAAREIVHLRGEVEEMKRLACYWRDRFNGQTVLRCDAQARAGRIARDARR